LIVALGAADEEATELAHFFGLDLAGGASSAVFASSASW